MSETRLFGSMPLGWEVPRQFDDGVIGRWESWRAATPKRVEAPERSFERAELDHFEVLTASQRLWRRREDGKEFRLEQADVLAKRGRRQSGSRVRRRRRRPAFASCGRWGQQHYTEDVHIGTVTGCGAHEERSERCQCW